MSADTFTCAGDLLERGLGLVVVTGEVDLETSPLLARELAALGVRGAARFVVDLAAVTFIDSSGLGVLVRARRAHGPVAIVAAAPQVLLVFDLTGLRSVLSVHQTRDEALKALGGQVEKVPQGSGD